MKKIEEQLKKAQSISMSKEERGLIRATLLRKITNSNSFSSKKEASPYVKNILVKMGGQIRSPFSFHAFSKVTAIALIVLLGGGTSLSFASEKSLPGETLYNFKVSIKETIEEVLVFNKEEKAKIQAKKIVRRVEEVKALKQEGELTEENGNIIEELIKEQSEDFIETATDLAQTDGGNESVVETTTILLTSLNDYSETISNNKEDEGGVKEDLNTEIVKIETPEEVAVFSEPVKEDLTLAKEVLETIEPEITNEQNTLSEISSVISLVQKNIEEKLPDVVETIKENQELEKTEAEAQNLPSVKTEDKICLEITDIEQEKIDRFNSLLIEKKIDLTNIKFVNFSEKDSMLVLSYENIVNDILIYENNISYVLKENILAETIGTPVNKLPFSSESFVITDTQAKEKYLVEFEKKDCVKTRKIAYQEKNILGRITYKPAWLVYDEQKSLIIDAISGEKINLPNSEYLR